jgi:hypothetical protein
MNVPRGEVPSAYFAALVKLVIIERGAMTPWASASRFGTHLYE